MRWDGNAASTGGKIVRAKVKTWKYEIREQLVKI
jgi:hypothetical protein